MNIQTIRDKDGLDNLIEKFCPNGVDYKTLGEIAQISRGGSLQKKDFVESGVPCIHYGQIYTRYNLFADKTLSFISEECARKQKMAKQNDIIMAVTSENLDDVCKCVAWLGNEDVAVSGHSAIIRHNQNAKYLTYFFQTEMFASQKRKLAHGTKVIEVTPDRLKIIKLPLPPLPIQQEIVRILDTFTNLTAELTAELTARRKQYEYYRDELLTFGEDIERRTIGDVCLKIASGGTPATGKMEYYGGDIPWLRTQEVDWNDIWDTGVKISKAGLENSSAKWIPENCVVVAMYGATAAKVAVNRIPLTTNQACCNLLINEKIVMHRYVFYWLSKEYLHLKEMGQGSQSNINAKIIRNYLIPIPPMERQQYIVSILDRFRELCSAFSGISEEILLRQKQYEYYRDKLLNFREK